jgi:methyl-accepting chemotaxis protein
MKKLKTTMKSRESGIEIVEDRNVNVVSPIDVNEIREGVTAANRQATEVKNGISLLREEFEGLKGALPSDSISGLKAEVDELRHEIEDLQRLSDTTKTSSESARELAEEAKTSADVSRDVSNEAKDDIASLREEILKVQKVSDTTYRLVKRGRKQSRSVPISSDRDNDEVSSDSGESHEQDDGDSISNDFVHDIHCLKYEVKKLKSLLKDQSSIDGIIEEIRDQVISLGRDVTESKDDITSIRDDILQVQKVSDAARRLAKKARKHSRGSAISNFASTGNLPDEVAGKGSKKAKSFVTATVSDFNDSTVSSDVHKLKHDFHCMKYEMKKVKTILSRVRASWLS